MNDPSFYVSMTPDDRKKFKVDATNIRQAVSKID